jgi:histidyl-tRNA synthetase
MQIMVITQGVDLAISEDELANETVITTLAKNGDNKFVILNAVGGHWSPSETRANIKGQNDRFNPALILVENNAFQASMVKDLQSTSTAPIKGFTTGGEKFDEFVGINSLAVAMENGQFIIPADPSHGRTIDYYERIKHEMMSFPSGHTGDWLMSLWFAFTALRSITSNEVYRVTATNVKPDVEY